MNQRETRNTIAKIENLITFIKRAQISNFRKEVEPFNGSLKTVVQIQDYVLHEIILESHLSPDLKWTTILSTIVTKRTEHLGFKMEHCLPTWDPMGRVVKKHCSVPGRYGTAIGSCLMGVSRIEPLAAVTDMLQESARYLSSTVAPSPSSVVLYRIENGLAAVNPPQQVMKAVTMHAAATNKRTLAFA